MDVVARAKPGLNLRPRYDRLWPFQTFAVRTLSFVARHKDPFFEDEREAPIVACRTRKRTRGCLVWVLRCASQ
jgi:hypothetical protein